MRPVRVIMALVVSLSVAMLPTAGSAVSMINPTTQDASANIAAPADMSTSMDSCQDETKANPCDHCPVAFCAYQAVSIASPADFHFYFPVGMGNLVPIPDDQIISIHRGSPPFRPPRV